MPFFRWKPLLPAVLALVLMVCSSACTSTRPPAPAPQEPPEELPTPTVRLADYEDFDAAPYQESPPEGQPEVQHDVPERLMTGRSTSTTTTVQGFRVQVYSTLERSAAVNLEEDAKNWWRTQAGAAPAGLGGNQLSVYTVYLQPYYRVRIGNFRTRAEAERARAFLAERFPDAFIVPDRVTVTR